MNYNYSDPIMSSAIHPCPDDTAYMPLERDYCSNFLCCGVPLADLHELVRHFEEAHVTVVNPDGSPLSPGQSYSPAEPPSPQTASSSALESPCSEYSSTPPPPNLFPTLTSAFQPPDAAFPSVTTSSSRDLYPSGHTQNQQYQQKEEQYNVDPMLYNEGYNGTASSGIRISLDVHDHSQFSLQPAQMSPRPVGDLSSVAPQFTSNYVSQNGCTPAYTHPPTLAPTPVYARPPTLSIITELHPQDEPTPLKKRRGETQSWVTASESEEILPARRRKVPAPKLPGREKTFKCPHAGCIKSYMNMNGLKYHLTKGVCDFNTRAT